MIKWLIKFFLIGLLFLGVDKLNLLEHFHVDNFGWALLSSLLLLILFLLIKPFLKLFSIPVNYFTLGLFSVILNMLMLAIVDGILGSHFTLGGFGSAIILSIVISLGSIMIDDAVKK